MRFTSASLEFLSVFENWRAVSANKESTFDPCISVIAPIQCIAALLIRRMIRFINIV